MCLVQAFSGPEAGRASQVCYEMCHRHWPDLIIPAVSPDGRYSAQLTLNIRAVEIYDIASGCSHRHVYIVKVSEELQNVHHPSQSAMLRSKGGGALLVRQSAR